MRGRQISDRQAGGGQQGANGGGIEAGVDRREHGAQGLARTITAAMRGIAMIAS